MIGANGLQGAIAQASPQPCIVFGPAHGRRTDPLGAVRATQVILGEKQVLRASSPMSADAMVAGVTEHIDLPGRVHVHDVDGGLSLSGHGGVA